MEKRFGGFIFLCLAVALLALRASSTTAAGGGGGAVWGADYFPNVALVSHEGKTVRFFDDLIKGKVVVIDFIYTSCPDACPLETAMLRQVQKILGDRVGKDVFMYSITIDPKVDTPEVLRHYAEKFQVGPGWLFLTGNEADITLLRKKLGLYTPEEQEGAGLSAHTLSLIIGNQATGQWMMASPYENPYVLATQVGSWLHNWKLPPRPGQSYASAPKVRAMSNGEVLFRSRCAACHTIGAEPKAGPDQKPLGPDLARVTDRRDRAWLTRWLTDPGRMLSENDPVATALLAAYNNVAMPNLRLNETEIQDLLTYMDEESRGKEPHHHDHGAHRHAPVEHE